jgi:hypothetical protein
MREALGFVHSQPELFGCELGGDFRGRRWGGRVTEMSVSVEG